MTPMIDVVFLLIVFFLVSSHLAKQESQLPLPLPSADGGREPVEEPTARVAVNVLPGGKILLAGKAIRLDELQRRLRYEFNDRRRSLQVRIRSDRTVPYRFVEPIMLTCARTGIWNVQIAVVRPEDASP